MRGTLVGCAAGDPNGHAEQLLWAPRTQIVQPNTYTTILACVLTTLLLLFLHHMHPSQGGIFALKLQFTEHYPSKPPRVRFTCEMFHPNVSPLPPAAACRTGYRLRQVEQVTPPGSCMLTCCCAGCYFFSVNRRCMRTATSAWIHFRTSGRPATT